MTREELIRMAEQAGLEIVMPDNALDRQIKEADLETLARFADRVAAAEREACAAVAEEYAEGWACARAIRARTPE